MIIIPDCNEKKNNNGWIFASFDMSCVSQADWARAQTCCVENRYSHPHSTPIPPWIKRWSPKQHQQVFSFLLFLPRSNYSNYRRFDELWDWLLKHNHTHTHTHTHTYRWIKEYLPVKAATKLYNDFQSKLYWSVRGIKSN